jgi:hypothetical protein
MVQPARLELALLRSAGSSPSQLATAGIAADDAPAATSPSERARKDHAQDHAYRLGRDSADGSPPCTCLRHSEAHPPLSSYLRTGFSALSRVAAVRRPIGTRTSRERSEPRRRWAEDPRHYRPSIEGCENQLALLDPQVARELRERAHGRHEVPRVPGLREVIEINLGARKQYEQERGRQMKLRRDAKSCVGGSATPSLASTIPCRGRASSCGLHRPSRLPRKRG